MNSSWFPRVPLESISPKALNWFRICVAALVLPNLPIWIARPTIQIADVAGYINVDYAIATVLFLYGYRVLGGGVVLIALLCDALRTFDIIFHFTQQDFFYCTSYVFHLPFLLVARNVVLLAAMAGAVLLLWTKVLRGLHFQSDRRAAIAIVLCVLCLKLVDTVNGLNGYVHLRESQTGHRIVGESIVGFVRTASWMFRAPMPNTPVLSASAPLRVVKTSVVPVRAEGLPNIVLVLVESMGYAAKPERDYLNVFDNPSLAARYDVQVGEVPFKGSTISGEFRELCGLQAGTRIGAQEVSHRQQCLPMMLDKQDYETEAIHGYQGAMFDREVWYSELGFQHTEFLEQLKILPGMHMCEGTFVGICDTDIAAHIADELKQPGKRKFIHWVTLNTHLPIARSVSREEECADTSQVDVCEFELLLRHSLEGIVQLANDPKLPPTEFVIVGDHAPPFVLLSRRDQFDQNFVPFVRLLPKTTPSTMMQASSSRTEQDVFPRKDGAKNR